MMALMGGLDALPKLIKTPATKDASIQLDERVDLEKAKIELVESKVFGGTLISADGLTAAVVATFDISPELLSLWDEYYAARALYLEASPEEQSKQRPAFEALKERYRVGETGRKDERIRIVREIRELVRAARTQGQDVHASGLPTIVVDMVTAIEEDLRTFGIAAVGFVAAFLFVVFRRLRWVLIPLLPCIGTALWIMALFTLEGKRTTVVTCNIPSLLLVIGLAHAIHLIVRFQEERAQHPEAPLEDCIKASLRSLLVPCFYSALTTCVGFISLVVAQIRPVVDFGIHMSLGVGLAFALSFLVFPLALILWPDNKAVRDKMDQSSKLLEDLASFALKIRWLIAVACILILGVSVVGAQRITVESSFVDYFRDGSEIHAGLDKIDRELGGTTQLEVLIKPGKPGYFKSREGLSAVQNVEKILRARVGQVGNVTGLASIVEETATITSAAGMKPNELFLLNTFVPRLRSPQLNLLKSYVTEDWSEARIVARIHDTNRELQRARFLSELRAEIDGSIKEPHAITGMFVLYTNMLQSLTSSQNTTAAAVFGLLFAMMLVLLRNGRAALLCMVPNALPILFVLGLMGWLGIPLDMATVMIASISLGIAIDGTIHYTVRYREEFARDGDGPAAMRRTHASIGVAIFYTTLTSIAGFWVLTLSNFNPNLYFGLFTGVAMLASLFGALTVLPVSLVAVQPFPAPEKIETQAPAASDQAANKEP
jgi:predicted RND superfamily exporter protein